MTMQMLYQAKGLLEDCEIWRCCDLRFAKDVTGAQVSWCAGLRPQPLGWINFSFLEDLLCEATLQRWQFEARLIRSNTEC